MKVFHETENKYYELLSYLLADKESINEQRLNEWLDLYLTGERDFEVIDTLFSVREGEEAIFRYESGEYIPVCSQTLPIRTSILERQALLNALRSRYVKHFLSDETINKIGRVVGSIEDEWNSEDVLIKGQYANGLCVEDRSRYYDVKVIRRAIQEKKAIIYDNVSPGKYEYRDVLINPVSMEYSIKNDQLRISAYNQVQRRFIKMNLSTMSNIRMADDSCEDLTDEFSMFLRDGTMEMLLEVEPTEHMIERCFRIFSYYDREAIYDRDANKYQLRIKYLKYDENEIIRDILSLGSSVVVIEPKSLRREVVRRIKMASENYPN